MFPGSESKTEQAKAAYSDVAAVITGEWKITNGEKEIDGVEDAGFHIIIKKLLQNEKTLFASSLVDALTENTVM